MWSTIAPRNSYPCFLGSCCFPALASWVSEGTIPPPHSRDIQSLGTKATDHCQKAAGLSVSPSHRLSEEGAGGKLNTRGKSTGLWFQSCSQNQSRRLLPLSVIYSCHLSETQARSVPQNLLALARKQAQNNRRGLSPHQSLQIPKLTHSP